MSRPQRVAATVLLTKGSGADARAVLKTAEAGDLPVDAGLVTRGTGYDLEEMPGKQVVALVENGDVVGFERP